MDNNNEVKSYYLISGIKIEFTGKGQLADLLRNEFEICMCRQTNQKTDLNIQIITIEQLKLFQPEVYSLSGKIGIGNNFYSVKEDGFTYLIKDLFDFSKVTELLIYPDSRIPFKKKLLELARTFLGVSGYSNTMIHIKNQVMSYSLFWYMFQIVLLKKDCSFIHSSILECKGEGIIFTGTGGCGKTSLCFKLLSLNGTKYYAEDFGIINKNGETNLSPKKISVYASDVRYGQKDLVEYFKFKINKSDKLLWLFSKLIGRNPIRKISPDLLIRKEQIGTKTAIKKVYYLARSSRKDVCIKKIEKEQLVDRAIQASFRELKTIDEILRNIKAVWGDSNFMTIQEIEAKSRLIYMNAFEHVELNIIYVPLKCSPEQILYALGWK